MPSPARPYRAEAGIDRAEPGIMASMPEVDDQRAGLRPLRAAFAPIEIPEVISNDRATRQGWQTPDG
jgi:hypothetical protein